MHFPATELEHAIDDSGATDIASKAAVARATGDNDTTENDHTVADGAYTTAHDDCAAWNDNAALAHTAARGFG